jgi:hypothetical protein
MTHLSRNGRGGYSEHRICVLFAVRLRLSLGKVQSSFQTGELRTITTIDENSYCR